MGLGGSIRYKQGKNQYTQAEMKSRVRRLRRKMRKSKGIDILLTHAPAYHINDGEDRPHEGFEAFVQILDTFRPKCFIHGHVHMSYSRSHKRESMYKDTRIINGFEKYVFDYKI